MKNKLLLKIDTYFPYFIYAFTISMMSLWIGVECYKLMTEEENIMNTCQQCQCTCCKNDNVKEY